MGRASGCARRCSPSPLISWNARPATSSAARAAWGGAPADADHPPAFALAEQSIRREGRGRGRANLAAGGHRQRRGRRAAAVQGRVQQDADQAAAGGGGGARGGSSSVIKAQGRGAGKL